MRRRVHQIWLLATLLSFLGGITGCGDEATPGIDWDGGDLPDITLSEVGPQADQGGDDTNGSGLGVAISASIQAGPAPLTVEFEAEVTGSEGGLAYLWDPGDGSEAQEGEATFTYTYDSPGTYEASVTVTDREGNAETVTVTIVVTDEAPPLEVTITADPTLGPAPLAVAFAAEASGGVRPYTFFWDLGDGSIGGTRDIAHTYEQGGSYTATLTVTDDMGAEATASVTVEVQGASDLSAAIQAEPQQGPAPLTVHLIGSASGGTAPYSFAWDLGEGSTDTMAELDFTYEAEGTYTVELTVTDDTGALAQAQVTIEVGGAAALAASILADPDQGPAPLTVQFTSQAEGGEPPYTYAWDLGDGTTDSVQDPLHVYTDSGTYTVVLTVTDAAGAEAQAQGTVVVEPPAGLEVTVMAEPTAGPAPLSVVLTAEATGGQGAITYTWDLGDGQTAEGAEVTHLFNDAAAYIVTVTATDEAADSAQASVTIEATTPNVPVVTVLAEPETGLAPLTVQFTGMVEGGNEPLAYAWDFGDGGTSDALSPEYQYLTAGTYEAVLTVTGADGSTGSASVTMVVEEDLVPTITATAEPVEGLAPLTVQFQATVAGGNGELVVVWDFGDGSQALNRAVPHTYDDPGQYEVHVTVTDGDGDMDEAFLTVVVLPDSQPQVTVFANPETGLAPLNVAFALQVTGGDPPFTYLWDFGTDTSADISPTHEFQEAGITIVTVVVTDSDGDQATGQVVITVGDDQMPLAIASAEPTEGLAPLDVQFYGQGLGGDAPLTYAWEFGDGDEAMEASPTHTYAEPGTYFATLIVTDASGDEAMDIVEITVGDDAQPLLSIVAEPTEGLAPLEVSFSPDVQGGDRPLTFLWDLGDGTTSDEVSPTHSYDEAGTYLVTCTVTDLDGDTDQDQVTIVVHGPDDLMAQASADLTEGQAPLTVHLYGQATGGQEPYAYQWDLGDGTASDQESPLHTYTEPGLYRVTLMVVDDGGQSDTDTLTIEVLPAMAELVAHAAAEPTEGAAPLTVRFTGSAENYTMPVTFEWTFGDGQTGTAMRVNHTYDQPGEYAVTLEVTDGTGATATDTLTIVVTGSSELNVTLTADPTEGYGPLDVSFDAEVTGGSEPYIILWDFGDGATQEGNLTAEHTYTDPGTYTATVTVTDGAGQEAFAEANIVVMGSSELNVTLTADPTQGGAPLAVSFEAHIEGGNEPFTIIWSFGDGQVQQGGVTATHLYEAPGIYIAVVTVMDGHGDMATANVTISVIDVPPLEVRLAAEPTSGESPLEVRAWAEVFGGTEPYSFHWDLGDGAAQDTEEPTITHIYEQEGTYWLVLTVTDGAGQEVSDRLLITVGNVPHGPDLVVEGIHLDNANGQTRFFIQVANRGSGQAEGSWLGLHIDPDREPGPGVEPLAEVSVPSLGPGESAVVEWTWRETVPGAHEVWAVADWNLMIEELDEGNNTFGPMPFEVEPRPLLVSLRVQPNGGIAPLEVTAWADVSGGLGPYSYLWDFGNGFTSTSPSPVSSLYPEAGEYELTVTVRDSLGGMAVDREVIIVRPPPHGPDLVVELLQAEPSPDGTISLVALVTNRGNEIAPDSMLAFYVDYIPDAMPHGEVAVPALEPTMETMVHWTWRDATPGDHQAWAMADWPNSIPEDNEENNLFGPIVFRVPGTSLTVRLDVVPTSGPAPLEVVALAEAIGGVGPYTYLWDFGDGHLVDGPEQVPYAYINEGEYLLTVIVLDSVGSRAQDSVVVTVHGAPRGPDLAVEWLDVSSSDAGVSLQARVTNVGDEAAPQSLLAFYVDSFGQGSEPLMEVEVPPLAPGDAVTVEGWVSLTAGDHRAWAMADWPQEILEPNETNNTFGPVSFTVAGTNLDVRLNVQPAQGQAPLAVTAWADVSGGQPPYTYLWDFGNGATSQGPPPVLYTYREAGTYNLMVTVIDAMDAQAQDTVRVDVLSPPRNPDLVVERLTSQMGMAGVLFRATVTNRGSADAPESRLGIYIDAPPGDNNPPRGEVAVPALGAGGSVDLQWLLQGAQPGRHQAWAMADWRYTVVESNEDNNIYGPLEFVIPGGALDVQLEVTPLSGTAPLTIHAFADTVGGTPPYTYLWDFGDGSEPRQGPATMEHTYHNPGVYTMTVMVTDAEGNVAHDSVTIVVTEVVRRPDLVVERLDVIEGPMQGLLFAMTVSNRGEAAAQASVLGLFIDQPPEEGAQPMAELDVPALEPGMATELTWVWQWPEPGIHEAWAFIDYGASVVESQEDNNILGPQEFVVPGGALQVSLTAEPTEGAAPLRVRASATVVGGAPPYSYRWDFGDGMGMTGPSSVEITYREPGVYALTVTVTDSVGSVVRDMVPITVLAVQEMADLMASHLEVIPMGQTVAFSFVIINMGQAPAAESVAGVFIDRMEPFDVVVPALGPGAAWEGFWTWHNPLPGDHTGYVSADWPNRVMESNEANNSTIMVTFTIGATANLKINEVYYDSPGQDGQAFIELFGTPGFALDGCSLVGVDGASGQEYVIIPLDGYTVPADGFFVVGQSAMVPETDLVTALADLQDGPDNVLVQCGAKAVLDALGYGSDSGVDWIFVGEGLPAPDPVEQAIGRDGQSTDTDNNRQDFTVQSLPSPGRPNTGPIDCQSAVDCLDLPWMVDCWGHWECIQGQCSEACESDACGDGVCTPERGETDQSCPFDCSPVAPCQIPQDCIGQFWDARCYGHWGCLDGLCEEVCDDRCGDGACDTEMGECPDSCPLDCQEPLTVELIVQPTQGQAPLTVGVRVVISGGTAPYQARVNMGVQGVPGQAPPFTYIYENPGQYRATAMVTDAVGTTASDVETIVVTEALMCQSPLDCVDLPWMVDCWGHWECYNDGQCGEVCESDTCGDGECTPERGESDQSCSFDCQAAAPCQVPQDCFDQLWDVRCYGHWSCQDDMTCEETCSERCGDGFCDTDMGECPDSCPLDCRN